MVGLSPRRLDQLEQSAKEATPGPWRIASATTPEGRGLETGQGERLLHVDVDAPYMDSDDAVHVANMNPATTLTLIAELRRLRSAIAEVREIHREGYVKPVMACLECENYDYPCDTIRALGDEA